MKVWGQCYYRCSDVFFVILKWMIVVVALRIFLVSVVLTMSCSIFARILKILKILFQNKNMYRFLKHYLHLIRSALNALANVTVSLHLSSYQWKFICEDLIWEKFCCCIGVFQFWISFAVLLGCRCFFWKCNCDIFVPSRYLPVQS